MKRLLTIAGAASQGSAGIQADLKTFQERNVYGMSVITATVANNQTTEQGIFLRPLEEIEAQFYAATEMVGVDTIKTGMLFSADIIEKVVQLIDHYPVPHVVVDPVMIGKMGSQLLENEAIQTMKQLLLPRATIMTPNRYEAAKLLDKHPSQTKAELIEDAKALYQFGSTYVIVKGGRIEDEAIDVLYDGERVQLFHSSPVHTIHTSGAGCSFASCLAAELAKGKTISEAVDISKSYVWYAIQYALNFGEGIGSVNHAAKRMYS
ncbi:phosphomethylpyrimidine kinase [Gracilibacillus halophilus YIM-C55.5]|uniref:Hydroxymethylpyrimidine/phosphomethylpyrimidine kinase n=1 Tax=Gracilibacillus halophilus YIM-C55.5 TaxID=1308866 RepID=N4WTK8_9BACI|nr:phosphomethylpyrimidine kinase [Gracilibacillus halophilus YIM-C55.5]